MKSVRLAVQRASARWFRNNNADPLCSVWIFQGNVHNYFQVNLRKAGCKPNAGKRLP